MLTGTRKKNISPLIRTSLFALSAIIPLTFIQLYFSGNWYAIGHSYSLAMLFGLTSYCLLCSALILSTRVGFLDKLFGHDKVLRFHGCIAGVAILTGGIHCILKAGYLDSIAFQVMTGIMALAIFLIIAFISSIYLSAGLLAAFPLFSRLRIFVSKRFTFDYSRVKFLHNGFSFAVVLILIHILWASSTQESLVRISFIWMLGGAALLRYGYHKLLRPVFNQSRVFHVETIEKPAPKVVRLTFTSERGNRLPYQSGQFAYIRIISPETGDEEHPFSFSSAPAHPNLQMTIKKIGDYTSRLENLKQGARVIIDGPYGSFTPIADDRNKVFIAGGIGITPILSILSEWHSIRQAPKTILFWSVAKEEDLIDRTCFGRMEKECPWFSFIPVLTQEHCSRYKHGRITPELLSLSGAFERGMMTDFYLCGPPAMIRHLAGTLKKKGVPKRDIHFELFNS
jgi:predicted ferric reductase